MVDPVSSSIVTTLTGLTLWAALFPFLVRKAKVGERADLYSDWNDKYNLLATLPDGKVNAVLDDRLHSYADLARKIAVSVRLQVVLIVMSLLAIGGQVPSFFGTDIQQKWLSVVALPTAIMYVWFEFGYLLALAIDNRVVAWRLIRQLEAATNIRDNSLLSRTQLLQQGTFLDAWFLVFRSEHQRETERLRVYHGTILFIYAALFALGHGCAITLVWLGVREARESQWPILFQWLVALGPVLTATVFCFTHYTFLVQGRNKNWLQPALFCMLPVVLCILLVVDTEGGGRRSGPPQLVVAGPASELVRERMANSKYRLNIMCINHSPYSYQEAVPNLGAFDLLVLLIAGDVHERIPLEYSSLSPLLPADIEARIKSGQAVSEEHRPGDVHVVLLAAPDVKGLADLVNHTPLLKP